MDEAIDYIDAVHHETVNEFTNLLFGLASVESATVQPSRRPVRVEVVFPAGRISDEARDVFNEFGAVIDNATVGDGLVVRVYLTPKYTFIDRFPVRVHGNSLVVTLPRDGLDEAGAEKGDMLSIYARDGGFRMVVDE